MSNLWRIFVYGTLKRGQYNHYVMRGATGTARLIAEAKLVRSHPIVVGKDGVPYMLPIEASKERVTGELYEVDRTMLEELDKLEEHPVWYLRTPTQVVITTPVESELLVGTTVDCEVYILRKEHVTEELLSQPHVFNYFDDGSYKPKSERRKE